MLKSSTRKLLGVSKVRKSFDTRQRSKLATFIKNQRAGKFAPPIPRRSPEHSVKRLPPTEKMSHIRNAKVKTMPYAKQHEWHWKGGSKRGSELRKSLAKEFKQTRKTGSVGRGLKGYV